MLFAGCSKQTQTPSQDPAQTNNLTPISLVESFLTKQEIDEETRFQAQLGLAELYHLAGETRRSEQLLRRLEAEKPDEFRTLALSWGKLGQVDELLRLTKADPKMSFYSAKDLSGEDKTRVLQFAETEFRGDSRWAARFASAYADAGELPRAEKMLDHFLGFEISPPDTCYNSRPLVEMLVVCSKLERTADKELILTELQKGIASMEGQERALSWAVLGQAFLEIGAEQEARECLKKAEASPPSHTGTRYIAIAWARLGEKKKALETLVQVTNYRGDFEDLAPHLDDSDTLYQVAEKISENTLSGKLESYHFSTTTYCQLIEAQIRSGRKDRATKLLENLYQVISTEPLPERLRHAIRAAQVATRHSLVVEESALKAALLAP